MRRQLSWPGYTRMSSSLATYFLVCWCLGEYWSRTSSQVVSTWKPVWFFSSYPSPTWLCLAAFWSTGCHAHSGLQRAAFTFPCFYWNKPWPLPGMEWACLSPKCKCHFSTSLVTTPFLAFIGNDIFLCSLSPTHAAGEHGQLLCFKRLKRKCWDL